MELDPSKRSQVRSAVLLVLSNLARSGSHGPYGVRDIFLRAADVLADEDYPGVERPGGTQSFRTLLTPHRTKSFPNFGLPRDVSNLLREVLWDLHVLRILSPAPSAGEIFDDAGRRTAYSLDGGIILDLDQFMITTHGSEILSESDERIRVYDHDHYLSSFWDAKPPADPEMMRYLSECLEVFSGGYLLASVVLLGASSERLIEVAAEALRDALAEPQGSKWYKTKFSNKRDISDRFKAFEGTLMREFGAELREAGLLDGFQGVVKLAFEVIRSARNLVAHPTGKVPSWNDVAGMIHNFSQYFLRVNAIVDYLNDHQRS